MRLILSDKKVKLNNDKSRVAAPPKPVSQQQFQQQAIEEHERRAIRAKETLEAARQFIKILEDKTLPDNKMPAAIAVESEILSKLINLADETNQDEKEHESWGSLGLIMILLSQCQKNRDRANVAEYNFEKLTEKVEKLEETIRQLEKLKSE